MANPPPRPALPRYTMRVTPGSGPEFELWRWAVSPMYDMDAVTPEARPDYGLQSQGFYYSEMPISAVRTSATRYERSPRVIAKAGLENILVLFYEEGDYLFAAEGEERLARAGDIVAYDLTRASWITAFAPATRSMSMIVPRHLLAPLVANPEGTHGQILPAGAPLNVLLVSHMRALLAQAPRLDPVAGLAVTRATAALVAACLGGANDARESKTASLSAAVLRLIRQTIDQHLADPVLSPTFLARHFQLSRAQLYRMFEPLGGVRKYIQQRRLMRAHTAICDPARFHEQIATISATYGFDDKTVFSRAYRALYGCAPSEARARARSMEFGAEPLTTAGSFVDVNRWLYGMETPPADLG